MSKLDNLSRGFFWKKSNMEKGLPLIAWDKVCMPKSKGGLGFHETEVANKACKCKLAWKLLTNHSNLWVHSIKAKYL